MSRILLIALLAMAGALAMAGTASADIGDIDAVTVDGGPLEGDDDSITVEGEVTCEEDTVEYGVITKVAEQLSGSPPQFNDDEVVEGVGAFGPAFEGVQDDQPCDENSQAFDVTVAANDGSDEFTAAPGGNVDVSVLIGTSANDGANGPGPIVGDISIGLADNADIE